MCESVCHQPPAVNLTILGKLPCVLNTNKTSQGCHLQSASQPKEKHLHSYHTSVTSLSALLLLSGPGFSCSDVQNRSASPLTKQISDKGMNEMSTLQLPSISRVKILLNLPTPPACYCGNHSVPDDPDYSLPLSLLCLLVIFNSLGWNWGAECWIEMSKLTHYSLNNKPWGTIVVRSQL